ncbi:MAG TPA: LacI family DNA-binding transcriptional regulator [Steroidobacteraceae bacterium]|nr:LacI family DNA-binding transcriptional regulator [Steroidobacteraceae bacterium]
MRTPKAPAPRQPIPKLEDVATRAGVSAATVSRYYNNPSIVAPATAARIQEAIESTGYVPNLLAGGLASSRSRLVAVLVPEVAQSIFNDTIEAMSAELSLDGNIVMLGLTGADNARMPQLVNAALARRADGIILTGIITDEETREQLRRRDVTVIETWGIPDDPIDIAVGFSHRAVGRDIARFLHGRGYNRPLLAVAEGARARQRRDGFLEEWRNAGHEPATVIDVPLPTRFAHSRLVWRSASQRDPLPDVVVCGSDLLAQGVIIEAQAAGLRVPDQVAVVGFGNLAIAGDMRPSITTVDVDGARIGREAVAVLRRRAAGERIIQKVIDAGFRLIARESA